MTQSEFIKPKANHAGINNKAKAEPKVPGALGSNPEPKPTPQNTMKRSYPDMALKLIAGLFGKVLVSRKVQQMI